MLKENLPKLMLAVFAVWLLSIPLAYVFFPFPDDASSFGDMFGAINALFSGMAFAGVIYALIMQDKEMSSNSEQLQKSLQATEASLRIAALAALLQEGDAALLRYERWGKTPPMKDYSTAKKTVRANMKKYRKELEGLAIVTSLDDFEEEASSPTSPDHQNS